MNDRKTVVQDPCSRIFIVLSHAHAPKFKEMQLVRAHLSELFDLLEQKEVSQALAAWERELMAHYSMQKKSSDYQPRPSRPEYYIATIKLREIMSDLLLWW